jgi:hypothetical protein
MFFDIPFSGVHYATGILKPTSDTGAGVLGRFPRAILVKVSVLLAYLTPFPDNEVFLSLSLSQVKSEGETDYASIRSSSHQAALKAYPDLCLLPVKELSATRQIAIQDVVDSQFVGSSRDAISWLDNTAQKQGAAFLKMPVLADQTLFNSFTEKSRGRNRTTLIELPKSKAGTPASATSTRGKGSRKRAPSAAAAKSTRAIRPRKGGAVPIQQQSDFPDLGTDLDSSFESDAAEQQTVMMIPARQQQAQKEQEQLQKEQEQRLLREREQEESQQLQKEQEQRLLREREHEVAKLHQEQSATVLQLQQSKLDILKLEMERDAATSKAKSDQELALLHAQVESLKSEAQSAAVLEKEKLTRMHQMGADQAKVAMLEQQRDLAEKHTAETHIMHCEQMEKLAEAAERQAQRSQNHHSHILQAMAMGSAQSGTDMLQILNVASGNRHQQQQMNQQLAPAGNDER